MDYTLEPKGKGEGEVSSCYTHAIKISSVYSRSLTSRKLFCVERINLILSPQGKALRKKSRWRHEEETSEEANASL
jgi:hypothetical protein